MQNDIGEDRNTCSCQMGKPQGRRMLGRQICAMIILKEFYRNNLGDADQVHLARDVGQGVGWSEYANKTSVFKNPKKKFFYSYSTSNKLHLLSQIIYSCKTLYMFRTVFPSNIRSSKLRIQQRYKSNSCCYLLLAAGSSSCLTYTVAVYAVLSS